MHRVLLCALLLVGLGRAQEKHKFIIKDCPETGECDPVGPVSHLTTPDREWVDPEDSVGWDCKLPPYGEDWPIVSNVKNAPKPEPVDVPAIKAEAPNCFDPKGNAGGSMPCGATTCADKSRILLTAEDGTKHCVKFPKEQ
jgi:hypothetical protein